MEQTLPTFTSADLSHSVGGGRPLSAESIQRLVVLALALVALTLKLAIALNTIGTNDVVTFYQFGRALHEHGLEWTYRHSSYFNHPPATASYLSAIYQLDQQAFLRNAGLSFPFLLRLPGIIADFVTVLTLASMVRGISRRQAPTWAVCLFAASPVSIMISGFHGNTDPVLVMFLLLACFFCLRENPILCGLFLAGSCQVKIISLLFIPIFFFFWTARRRGIAFFLPFVIVTLVLWSKPLLYFPALFFKNVLSYGSYSGIWGITYCLRIAGLTAFQKVGFHHSSATEAWTLNGLKLLIVGSVLAIAWCRRKLDRTPVDSIAYAWIIFFVFSPGVCAQYLVWLAPFVLLLSPTLFLWFTASSSLFLFIFYNTTAGGLPWYVAISTDKLNSIWAPWGLLPWATISVALLIFCRNAPDFDPSPGSPNLPAETSP